ncbi:PREDICTED: uncharacterized protein LOC106748019 [Dinoponera quadriceps]|uniref:Uncharacterized protein LOC106748019 n=1 Tax=Dinoponera quadriceps TaxID=609295 RepID=A0A6P3XUT4_DINQU|nr:PREDICTED: uncharacterized protein LOC106748019 [Dinoponera quadriceps]XP_014481644.1 PREDICTED: uncharacterized protein LOC106748019 [Dinoponera quadriceps]
MCEVSKGQRRTFRDQDPPRICNKSTENLLRDELEFSRSTPSSPTTLQRAASLEKCFSEPEFFQKQRELLSKHEQRTKERSDEDSVSSSPARGARDDLGECGGTTAVARSIEDLLRELSVKVPSPCKNMNEVITNGLKCDLGDGDALTNGRKMAPVLGVPPPPPPAPHMGPDGLILPKKPYNPCLTSTNHKDLHRELLFNQKIGRNVLNQKSELQRALERQREAASRREAERNREESYKDDPRTALQRAIEQRARHIQITQEQQSRMEPPSNLLITARAKLRPRTESQ